MSDVRKGGKKDGKSASRSAARSRAVRLVNNAEHRRARNVERERNERVQGAGREKRSSYEGATCPRRRGTVKERFKASLIPDGPPVVNDEIGSDCRQLPGRGGGRPLLPARRVLFFRIYSARAGTSTFHRLATPATNDGDKR